MAIGKLIWRSKPRGRRHKGKATGADVVWLDWVVFIRGRDQMVGEVDCCTKEFVTLRCYKSECWRTVDFLDCGGSYD